jgi:peptidoglycan/LPS O-acetylase OafA/YrhL
VTLRRDDRVLAATHWASLVIVVILIPALVFLWGLPGRTPDLWAWTIKPEMTPTFMGAGYGAGAFFFLHAFRAKRWHPASAGVLSAAIFATLMLVATLIHWDRFNHGHAPFLAAAVFYGWVGVYILSPVGVGVLWFLNQRRDPRRTEAGDPAVSQRVRAVALVFGVVAIGAGAMFFVSPDTAIDVWPWKLTPLTARVLASFTVQVGFGALLLSRDPRWSSWRVLLETFVVATALLLVGAIRAWDDFDHGDPATWAFVGGLVGAAAAVVALRRTMNAQAG